MEDTLRQICLFGSLDDKQIKKLGKISTIKKLKPGNILFYEGDEPSHLFFLIEGLVKLYRFDQNNNINILSYYYTQTLIGEAATLQRLPHQLTAECDTECKVLIVSFDGFEKDFLKNPDVALGLIMQLVEKVKNLMNTKMQQSSMQKLAQLIYENQDLFKRLKKYKIAEILNMAPETFSRNLKKLKNDKIIFYDKNSFEVLDRNALSKLFASCPSAK